MDYLPGFTGSETAVSLRVPFIAQLDYDFQGYETFAERHGCVTDNGLDTAIPIERLAGLMQTWLYFGLLSECTGIPTRVSDMVMSGPDGETLLSGAGVAEYLESWILRLWTIKCISFKWRDAICHAKEVLEFTIAASVMFDKLPGMGDSRFAPVAISVKALIATLAGIYNDILSPGEQISLDDDRLKPYCSSCDLEIPYPARYLHSFMFNKGWCPSLTRRICKRYNYDTVLYLTQIDRPENIHHNGCTTTNCVAYSINQASYETRHVSHDCSCTFLTASTARIVSIIESGYTPVISIDAKNGHELEVQTAEWTEQQPRKSLFQLLDLKNGYEPIRNFVAVSHVWADGLGNARANAIPQCQFDRIVASVRSEHYDALESSPSCVWMDTLCIPVGAEHQSTRMKAIDRMAYIYAAASFTLVLDNALAGFSSPTLGLSIGVADRAELAPDERRLSSSALDAHLKATELLGKVLCSPWAGRSWTLQEGVLSNRAQFSLDVGSLTSTWLRSATVAGLRSNPRKLDPTFSGMFTRAAHAALGITCIRHVWASTKSDWQSSAPRAKRNKTKVLLLAWSALKLALACIFLSRVSALL